jgi:hypothetical protein
MSARPAAPWRSGLINMASGLLFNIMVGAAFATARNIYNMFVAAVAPLLDVAHNLIG